MDHESRHTIAPLWVSAIAAVVMAVTGVLAYRAGQRSAAQVLPKERNQSIAVRDARRSSSQVTSAPPKHPSPAVATSPVAGRAVRQWQRGTSQESDANVSRAGAVSAKLASGAISAVAPSPVTRPYVHLSELESIAGHYVVGEATMSAKTYPNSLFDKNPFSSTGEFNIGKKYRRFSCAIGFDDDAPSQLHHFATFVVKCDGRQVFASGRLEVGDKPKTVDLDVTGVVRLVLDARGEWGASDEYGAVWGTPRLWR